MNGYMKHYPFSVFEITTEMLHGIKKQNVIEYIDKHYVTIFVVHTQRGEIKIKADYFT